MIRDQALVVLGLNTGFRATELLSVNVGDVFKDGRVASTVTVARRRLKGGRGRRRNAIASRTIPLNEAAVAALQKICFPVSDPGRSRRRSRFSCCAFTACG